MRRTSTLILLLTALNALGGVNHWTTSGPQGVRVAALEVDPTNPDVAFLETPAGTYRTTNGGDSWQLIRHGFRFVAPGTPTTLYAWDVNVIFISSDERNHWKHTIPVSSPARHTAMSQRATASRREPSSLTP